MASFRTFARDIVWDQAANAPAADGVQVTAWTEATGGFQLQLYSVLESAMTLRTQGGAHTEFKIDGRDDCWLDAGQGRWHRWSVESFRANSDAAQASKEAAVAAASAAEQAARSAAAAASAAGGGTGTGTGTVFPTSTLDLAFYFQSVNI